MPVPMIAPIPSDESVTGPKTRRSRCPPAISSSSTFSDFLANSWFKVVLPLQKDVKSNGEENSRSARRRQRLFAVHDQRHWAVVDQFDPHVGAEDAGRDRDAQRL